MLKFKFDYQAHTLAFQSPGSELWYEITETFAGNFGSLGFQLTDGWISFSIYSNRIRAFFKQMKLTDPFKSSEVAYYRKDLPKACPVIFTFSAADQVEKVGSVWVKKGAKT
jgi:hypothetical protein